MSRGLLDLSEREWQDTVLHYARLTGWLAYHTHDSRRSEPGFPDLVLARIPHVVWVELKTDRGSLTADQSTWLQVLLACGQEAYVWRPRHWKAVQDRLRRGGEPADELSLHKLLAGER